MGLHDETQSNLQALIIMEAHKIEKGLALPKPRSGFGQNAISNLVTYIKKYSTRFGPDKNTQIGLDTLLAYYHFHENHGHGNDHLRTVIEGLALLHKQNICESELGGTISMDKAEIHSHSALNIEAFLNSRHSIRQFDPKPVELTLIKRAISLAITSPSVCNRQPWKVRVLQNSELIKKVLDLQNGNRGFHDQINLLLLVIGDLECFVSISERNQVWIDGGIFSMSLLLALHSLCLGTCCLNWSVIEETDSKLRELLRLPDSEVIIMLVAVGHIPERICVTKSTRKPINEVMIIDPPIENIDNGIK